jgi:hypothetical protein
VRFADRLLALLGGLVLGTRLACRLNEGLAWLEAFAGFRAVLREALLQPFAALADAFGVLERVRSMVGTIDRRPARTELTQGSGRKKKDYHKHQ